jgi:hypothetical protein
MMLNFYQAVRAGEMPLKTRGVLPRLRRGKRDVYH